jgi:protoheme IX farnesyltransferase
MLIVFTAIVGMFVSVPGWPGTIPLIFGTLGIGLAASSAAVFNHVLDARIDIQMMRTRGRPLPQGKLTEKAALMFASGLCVISMFILWFIVNPLTAVLTFFSLIGYAVVYTVFLKRATPQNIVIGGAAGAAPPVLGWTAVTNELHAGALLMFLIVFVWTRLNILLYTILLVLVTILPYLIGMSGLIYLLAALLLDAFFLYYAIQMYRVPGDQELPMKTFRFSISYLGFLFAAILIDHYLLFRVSL